VIDQVRRLLSETDDLLDQLAVARKDVREESTALRLETCRLRCVRNTLARELDDLELDAGKGVLVQVQAHDYQRRSI